jgi:predicted nucleic acid-binding protein
MPVSSDVLLEYRDIVILDSWPVMEWLKDRDPAATVFEALIDRARTRRTSLYLSTINLGEIYYNSWIEWNEARAERTLERLRQLPIFVVHPTAEDAIAAARLKGRYNISYADCFTAVLALELRAPVLTGDIDFLKLAKGGLLEVEWLGR